MILKLTAEQTAFRSITSAIRLAGTGLVYLATVAAQSIPSGVAGDPAPGKALFEGNGSCLTCHSIENRERKRGPDLSWIGMLRTPESLRRSLIAPGAHSSASKLPAREIDHLVAYLRTLRSIPPSEPRERTRSIAPTSENVEFFNRTGRDAEERSDDLIKSLEIREGARVADIGAGTGYFTWRLARQAGPQGRVIAVDIQQSMLDLAAETVKQHGLVNVDYVLGKPSDPKLPHRSLDLVFIAYSYHEFTEPETILETIRRSLKPGGRLVIVEYAKESKLAPASTLHKMSFDEIRSEIEPIGFDLDRILDFLPMQHGLIFTVR
jgi:ubiquinone/menaquinone biosynthesis C-methylase UbiE/mono/diheme cytochrome c family protein